MDRNKLIDDLTEFFILYLQATECPPVTAAEFNRQRENGIEKYRNNPLFNAKIKHLTAHILRIVKQEEVK